MKTFNFFSLFIIVLYMSACGVGDDVPVEPTPKPEIIKSEIIIDSNIITNGLSFSRDKGEKSVSFSTNENWTLSIKSTRNDTSWCTSSTTSGNAGNASVKFNVTENENYYSRSISVTIKSGTDSKTFTICQQGKCEENEDKLREALIKLYKSTNGDNWRAKGNWCSDLPITEWAGITISNGIYSLNLRSNNLTGNINQNFPHNTKINLDCSNNQLSSINLSDCMSLQELRCHENKLEFIDLSGCTNLNLLSASHNSLLSSLDISNCTALDGFYINSCNQLTTLNVSNCACKYLIISSGALTSLDDVASCYALENLELIDVNTLSSLDISGCNKLKTLRIQNTNQLKSLDASNCTALASLRCTTNKSLTSLNVSGCTALQYLYCDNNSQLTSLDVSDHATLEWLFCENNQLNSLNVSGCTALESLHCYNNQLTSLDVSDCTALKSFYCKNNKLTSIIPEWFSQLHSFSHDVRYTYHFNDKGHYTGYTDHGVGWWYPGEPQKRYHGKN